MIFYLLILYKIPLIIKTQFPISTLLETCRSCWYLWYIPELFRESVFSVRVLDMLDFSMLCTVRINMIYIQNLK